MRVLGPQTSELKCTRRVIFANVNVIIRIYNTGEFIESDAKMTLHIRRKRLLPERHVLQRPALLDHHTARSFALFTR